MESRWILFNRAIVAKHLGDRARHDTEVKQSFNVSIEELAETMEPAVAEEDRMDLGMVLQQVTPELARKYGLPRTSGLLVVEVEIDSYEQQHRERRLRHREHRPCARHPHASLAVSGAQGAHHVAPPGLQRWNESGDDAGEHGQRSGHR